MDFAIEGVVVAGGGGKPGSAEMIVIAEAGIAISIAALCVYDVGM